MQSRKEASGRSSACLSLRMAVWESQGQALLRLWRMSPSTGTHCCCHCAIPAEEQIRAGSTDTAGRGQGELSFHWKCQHLLHPWEKQEGNGDRCAWMEGNLCLLQLGTSHRSGLLSKDPQGQQSLQLGAHPREKPSSCCLQIRIPNAWSYIRQLQKK